MSDSISADLSVSSDEGSLGGIDAGSVDSGAFDSALSSATQTADDATSSDLSGMSDLIGGVRSISVIRFIGTH